MPRTGNLLLEFFRSIQSPNLEGVQGEDLDWLWDSEASDFLSRLIDSVNPEVNLLTPRESQEWSLFKTTHQEILKGPKLQEALKIVNETTPTQFEFSSESIQDIQKTIETLKEEKALLSKSLDSLERFSEFGSKIQSDLIFKSNSINEIRKKENKEEIFLNQKVLEISEKFSFSLLNLKNVLDESLKDLKNFPNKDKCLLLAEVGLNKIQVENVKFHNLVDEYVAKQFLIDCNGNEEIWNYDSIIERSEEEFTVLVEDNHRLYRDYKYAKKLLILGEAGLGGEKTGLKYLFNYDFIEDVSFSETQLLREAEEYKKKLTEKIQVEISRLASNELETLTDQNSSYFCKRIFNTECQMKLLQQRYFLDRLKYFKEILLKQTALKEILGVLYSHEFMQISNIFQTLNTLEVSLQALLKNYNVQNSTIIKAKKEAKESVKSTIIDPEKDPFIFSIGKLIIPKSSNEEVAFTVDSIVESISKVRSLLVDKEKIHESRKNECRTAVVEALAEMNFLKKALGLNHNNKPILESEEYFSLIAQLETKLRSLELAVKNHSETWNYEKKQINSYPVNLSRKKLWSNYFNSN